MLERPTEWVEGTLGYASFPPLFLPLLFLSGSERGWGLRQTQNGMRCNEEIDREGGGPGGVENRDGPKNGVAIASGTDSA